MRAEPMLADVKDAVDLKPVDDVPFIWIATLFEDLRKTKLAGKKRSRSFGAKRQADDRKSLLTSAWLRIAKFCGYRDHIHEDNRTDALFVPAYVLPPSESYRILCLLSPMLDSTNSYLGMKESKLADAFVKALDLVPSGDEAQWLKHHKEHEYRPHRWKHDADIVDGNFATILKAVLTGRCPTEGSMTVGTVWKSLGLLSKVSRGRLSRIARVPKVRDRELDANINEIGKWPGGAEDPEDARSAALRGLVQLGTAQEVAEVSRIILKDVDIRLSEDLLFSWLHPGAKQHYNQIHDIQRLLHDCHDPNFEVGEASVQIGQYASVMLTMRPSRKRLESICATLRGNGEQPRDGVLDREDKGALSTQTAQILPYFYMEPKLDGERLQLHKWVSMSEDKIQICNIKTFSRRGNDSSGMYAGALKEVVTTAVQAESFILDGEIMIWDNLKASWVRFEDIRTIGTAIAKRSVPEGSSYTLIYMVFDVMYVDQGSRRGESRRSGNMVIRLPLHRRRTLLEKLIAEQACAYGIGARAKVQVVKSEQGHNENELIRALQRYETLGYEGVVAKNPEKAYALAARDMEVSIKLKPDYFDGGIQDLDVLVLGAKYSSSRGHRAQRAGKLSSFLIGVRADSSENAAWKGQGLEWEPKMRDCKWVAIGSVGTGYSDQELAELHTNLHGEWKPFDRKELPSHFERRDYAGLLNDVAKWIEPWKSMVLTIQAFELNRRYYNLRFPRVKRLNWSKPYYDVPTFSDVLDLDDNKLPAIVRPDEADVDDVSDVQGRKILRTTFDVEEAEAMERAKKEGHLVTGGRNPRAVIATALGAQIENVERLSTVLEGLSFYVIASNNKLKEQLELRIHELGGSFVQNFTNSVDFVICSSSTLPKVTILRDRFGAADESQPDCSILRTSWIDRCYSAKTYLPPVPNDVVHATKRLNSKLYAKVDKYSDSWVENADVASFTHSISEIQKSSDSADYRLNSVSEASEVLDRTSDEVLQTTNIFHKRYVYVPETAVTLSGSIQLLRCMGAVVVHKPDPRVSYILIHSSLPQQWSGSKELRDAQLIDEMWVRNCVKTGKIQSEDLN